MIIKNLKNYFSERKEKSLKMQNTSSFNKTNELDLKKVRQKSYLYQRAQNLLAKN